MRPVCLDIEYNARRSGTASHVARLPLAPPQRGYPVKDLAKRAGVATEDALRVLRVLERMRIVRLRK